MQKVRAVRLFAYKDEQVKMLCVVDGDGPRKKIWVRPEKDEKPGDALARVFVPAPE